MANAYIIVFDRTPEGNYSQFHEWLKNDPLIKSWWHYIKSCYIVISEADVTTLSDRIAGLLTTAKLPTTHLVLEVDLNQRQGRLTPEAWDWLREKGKVYGWQ